MLAVVTISLIFIFLVGNEIYSYIIKKNKKETLITKLNKIDTPIVAKYLYQVNLSSRLIIDIYYVYEFEFEGKKYLYKHYPDIKDAQPPNIPKNLLSGVYFGAFKS